MRKEVHSSNVPEAVGPFSQAIETKDLIFISGQLPIDVKTGEMKDTIEEQTHMCFKNASFICQEAGVDIKNAAKVTVLLDNIDDYKVVNEIYATYFEAPYPARVAYEVAKLPMGAKIELAFIIAK